MIWLFVILLLLPIIWPHRWLIRNGHGYLLRYPIVGGDGIRRAPWPFDREGWNLYLHVIIRGDGPAFHSHPWPAKALILWGRYRDYRRIETPFGYSDAFYEEYRMGQVNEIPPDVVHTLQLRSRFVVTLCWTGKKHGRGWGFLVDGELKNASGKGAAAYDEVVGG